MPAPIHKYSAFPSFVWHPETGERKLCKSPEDVPEGYLDHHPANPLYTDEKASVKEPGPAKDPAPADEVGGMSRAEIVAALKEGGVKFTPNTGTPKLAKILEAEVDNALSAMGHTLNNTRTLKEKYGDLVEAIAIAKAEQPSE